MQNYNYQLMSDITHAIKEIIAHILNGKLQVDDIDNDTPLFLNGLGMDSIDLLQLIPSIEKKFGITVGVKNQQALRTVNYLAEFVYSKITNHETVQMS